MVAERISQIRGFRLLRCWPELRLRRMRFRSRTHGTSATPGVQQLLWSKSLWKRLLAVRLWCWDGRSDGFISAYGGPELYVERGSLKPRVLEPTSSKQSLAFPRQRAWCRAKGRRRASKKRPSSSSTTCLLAHHKFKEYHSLLLTFLQYLRPHVPPPTCGLIRKRFGNPPHPVLTRMQVLSLRLCCTRRWSDVAYNSYARTSAGWSVEEA